MNDPARTKTVPAIPARQRATLRSRPRSGSGVSSAGDFDEKTLDALRAQEPNCCRGLSLRPIIERARREDYGAFLELLERKSPELARWVQPDRIQPSTWYPISWYSQLHSALRIVTGGGYRIAWEIGRESVQHDLTRGLFRVFLKIVSPAFLIERGPGLFRSYVKKGRLRVRQLGRQELELEYYDCLGFDTAIFHDFFGGTEGALLAAGGKDVALHVLEGAQDGDVFAKVRVSYR